MTTIATEGEISILQVSDGGGLLVEIDAGRSKVGAVITDHALSTLAMVDASTNYVFVDIDSVIKVNQVGFPAGSIPLAEVTTAGAAITGVVDKRAFLEINTGVGSTDTFQLNFTIVGSLQEAPDMDNFRILPYAATLLSVRLTLENSGQSGITEIDLFKRVGSGAGQGSSGSPAARASIYTTPANRPKIAAAAGAAQDLHATNPDITSFAAGDILSMDVLNKALLGPKDLTVAVTFSKD